VLDQVALRRRARGKMGERADQFFWTRDGLEMATRWPVARWRAAQLSAAGARSVTDVGLGLGVDSLAFLEAGLAVRGLERDAVTAELAQANLALIEVERSSRARRLFQAETAHGRAAETTRIMPPPAAEPVAARLRSAAAATGAPAVTAEPVVPAGIPAPPGLASTGAPALGFQVDCAEARDLTVYLPGAGQALFLDPSRRTAAGPTWDLTKLSPSWDEVCRTLAASADGLVVAKLAPGLPHRLLPPGVEACWVSHDGDLVELSLWRGWGEADARLAVLLPGDRTLRAGRPEPPPGPLGEWLWEPDPAVSRAGATGELAELLQAHPLAAGIAYLTGPAATREQFPASQGNPSLSPNPVMGWPLPDDAGLRSSPGAPTPDLTPIPDLAAGVPCPFASAFVIDEVLPFRDQVIRSWLRRHHVGRLEIKTRGLNLDPAQWRRQLRPAGANAATLVATPTLAGAVVLVVRRVGIR